MKSRDARLTRRELLKIAAGVWLASQLGPLETVASVPQRAATDQTRPLPGIQFDLGHFVAPAATVQGVAVRFPPVFTLFLPATLTRRPTMADQAALEEALSTLEQILPFDASGVMTMVSYGVPYFDLLAPGGLANLQVAAHVPKLLDSTGRPTGRLALEEAVPGPTDVGPGQPGVTKQRFNVPVAIERNHVLFTFRSDSMQVLTDVFMWLNGADELGGRSVPAPAFDGLFAFQPSRLNFVQQGLPRKVAEANELPFASQINPDSPMWMGFADQHVSGSGPPEICTFQGNASLRLTTAQAGDYLADAAVQHLSHVLLDLEQFYRLPDPRATTERDRMGEPYSERVQYMFRSNPPPSMGYEDQFSDGGGPAFIPNTYAGPADALANAIGRDTVQGQNRMGHLCGLHRSSRAPDGTPAHIRMDGPGFNNLDVPDGSNQPTLEFTIFVPTAEFFRQLRANSASLDLVEQHGVGPNENGLKRFLTATRRQNFLVPPRAHRSFPLLEVVGR
jgi:hypothetical protein